MIFSGKNFTETVHDILKQRITEGSIVLDATVGNGYDTLFLSSIVKETGRVYGFDIQQQAISTTSQKLEGNQNVTLFCRCHSELSECGIPPIDAAVFNLGYLPKGNRSIITKPETTIQALKQALELLKPGGIITVMSYSKHEQGEREKNGLIEYFSNLDDKKYIVTKMEFINRPSCPPIIFIIEKAQK